MRSWCVWSLPILGRAYYFSWRSSRRNRFDHRYGYRLGSTLYQLPSLHHSRTLCINTDIITESRGFPEEIENGDSVSRVVSSDEWIGINPNFSKVRCTSQPSEFGWVGELVLAEIKTFKRRESLDSSKRLEAVSTKV